MVDGHMPNGPHLSDVTYIKTTSPFQVGSWADGDVAATDTDEVVAFTRNRAPRFLSSTQATGDIWTNSEDHPQVLFDDKPLIVPVTMWIRYNLNYPTTSCNSSVFDCNLEFITGSVGTATSFWAKERLGIAFDLSECLNLTWAEYDSGLLGDALTQSSCEIIDATGLNPGTSLTDDPTMFVPFDDPDDVNDVGWTNLESSLGKTADRLNIYWVAGYVSSGNYMSEKAMSNYEGGQILMGSLFTPSLLAHEVGHALSLRHVRERCDTIDTPLDGSTVRCNMDVTTNILKPGGYSLGDLRKFLSEGQVFRSHAHSTSVLNILPVSPPPSISLGCPTKTSDQRCIPIDKRLWADCPEGSPDCPYQPN